MAGWMEIPEVRRPGAWDSHTPGHRGREAARGQGQGTGWVCRAMEIVMEVRFIKLPQF